MNYWNEAIRIEETLARYLKEEKIEEFNKLLKDKETFYHEYAKNSSEELKKFLSSSEYKELQKNIQNIYEKNRESLREEIKELTKTKNATTQYRNNSHASINYFSKKV
ncbi:hypothetical protein [Clostridium sp. 'White wine YQ']|uniref:hypothetical protein n=1 Tax=Clostridium sp. 'White wine YQ' TaxID=3027474 RepID=UPI00236595D5|nr:hypothetical protein [Clostridium sp. 'White wine YQ']MDD7794625.1 hypothetical protein [Clostridium sp. 'White wine YQ']